MLDDQAMVTLCHQRWSSLVFIITHPRHGWAVKAAPLCSTTHNNFIKWMKFQSRDGERGCDPSPITCRRWGWGNSWANLTMDKNIFSIAEGLIILYHSINHFNWPPANPKYFPDIGLPTITIEKKLQPISAFLNIIIPLLLLPLQSDCFTINVSITASWTRWEWLCLFQTVEKGHLWPSDFIEMRPSASFMLTSSHRRVGYLSEMKADIPFSSTYSPLCHHRPCHS